MGNNIIKQIFSVCVICREGRVLLGFKKKGLGAGRWNGFGGKLEAGETPEQAVKREITEEADIIVSHVKYRGILKFDFLNKPDIIEVHVFSADNFDGEPKETEEMKPQWFGVDEIPFKLMWPSDSYWLPLLLSGKNFNAKFLDDGNDSLLSHRISIIETS